MPTRFCLKNIGDPSSMSIAKATARNTGDKINKRIMANKRLHINNPQLLKFDFYESD